MPDLRTAFHDSTSSPLPCSWPAPLWQPEAQLWRRRVPGNPDALGTERVMTVDARTTPRVGRKQFPDTLPLADKELVLTFDDGPWPTTTPKVLAALKARVRARHLLFARPQCRRPPRACPPRAGRRPLARPPHLFAPPAQPYVAAKSRGRDQPRHRRATNSRSTARPARGRRRRFSAFPALRRTSRCSTVCRTVGSWCSAPMSGPATGIR